MADAAVEKLNQQLHAALEQDTRINPHASEVRLAARGQQFVLEGRVEDIVAKRIAARLARRLVGAAGDVEDQVRIAAPDIGEGALRDKVAKALLDEPVFVNFDLTVRGDGETRVLRRREAAASGLIEASVTDGVVTLSGQVYSLTHRRIAEVLLWWLSGCQRIDNRLKIDPPERDSDAELTDAARMVLDKDPLIDAGQVRIVIDAGTATLTGQLPSAELRDMAARDIWALPGIRNVHNRIEVGHGLG